MHKFKFDRDIVLTKGKIPIQGNEWYVADNVNAGFYMEEQSHYIHVEHFINYSFNPNAKSTVFIRAGGFGDLLFITPIARKLKQQGMKIGFATTNRCRCVIENNTDIDEILLYPTKLSKLLEYENIVTFEDILEYHQKAKTTHAIDLMAESIGITIEDHQMRLFLKDEEFEKAIERFPKTKKRIAVQLFASAHIRTYPRAFEVCMLLAHKGYEVFAFSAEGKKIRDISQGFCVHQNLLDIMNIDNPPSFRESCAILKTCDCVVAPDSSLAHVAGALDIPCVAIYGSFDWKCRTKYCKKTYSLMGNATCSPCFHHARAGHHFPENMPCEKTHTCIALENITAERVVSKVEQMIK